MASGDSCLVLFDIFLCFKEPHQDRGGLSSGGALAWYERGFGAAVYQTGSDGPLHVRYGPFADLVEVVVYL